MISAWRATIWLGQRPCCRRYASLMLSRLVMTACVCQLVKFCLKGSVQVAEAVSFFSLHLLLPSPPFSLALSSHPHPAPSSPCTDGACQCVCVYILLCQCCHLRSFMLPQFILFSHQLQVTAATYLCRHLEVQSPGCQSPCRERVYLGAA